MNEKEAREIINLWNSVPPKEAIEREARFAFLNQAKGYLECLSQVAPLVEAAQHCAEYFGECQPIRRLEEALAQWRKVQREE